ncbi:MAG: hypothetical protein HZC28_09010 [Spirochaetes bacterium]|nr:hypothetical protein [Spirochaetota bacterium]
MKIPLSLSIYEHAAKVIGRSPWDVSRSGALMLEAHSRAYELYRHSPVVIGIDIYNTEAEAYGCVIEPCKDNTIPAIHASLFASIDETRALTPFNPVKDGRLALVVNVARDFKARFPEADVRVPVSGPFSLAQSLLGMETLMIAAAMEPDATREFLARLIPGQIAFTQYIKDNGLSVAFFESGAAPPLLSPDQFRDIELPVLKEIMRGVASILGNSVPCIIGGNTAPIVPHMVATGTNFVICPAETNREEFLAAIKPFPGVKVRVNMKTQTYSYGTKDDIKREIDEILELAQRHNGLLLGTGAIPYETPEENILFIKEYVD